MEQLAFGRDPPRWVLMPTSPVHAAGMRTDPAPSDPSAAARIPDVTAAAEEPPGVRPRCHGLRVVPNAGPSVNGLLTQLRSVGLADDHRVGFAQQRDGGRVGHGARELAGAAERGGQAGEVDVVLDRHGHAEQRLPPSGPQPLVHLGRFREGRVVTHVPEGVERGPARVHPPERGRGEPGGGDFAGGELRDLGGKVREVEARSGHGGPEFSFVRSNDRYRILPVSGHPERRPTIRDAQADADEWTKAGSEFLVSGGFRPAVVPSSARLDALSRFPSAHMPLEPKTWVVAVAVENSVAHEDLSA